MEYKEQEDQRLLEIYRENGDPETIDVLVDRYGPSLFSFLRASAFNPQDAEEVFQETWLKVMRNAGGFHGGSFQAWLTTIARRTLIDRVRRKSPSLTLDQENDAGVPRIDRLEDPVSPHPGRSLESGEDLARIRSAVRALPDDQREVFLMRTLQELSFKEIARILAIPLNTALGRMHYAVVKLRKELSE